MYGYVWFCLGVHVIMSFWDILGSTTTQPPVIESIHPEWGESHFAFVSGVGWCSPVSLRPRGLGGELLSWVFWGISSSLGGWEKRMQKGIRFKKVGPTEKNVHPSKRGHASIIMEGTFAFKKWQLHLKEVVGRIRVFLITRQICFKSCKIAAFRVISWYVRCCTIFGPTCNIS